MPAMCVVEATAFAAADGINGHGKINGANGVHFINGANGNTTDGVPGPSGANRSRKQPAVDPSIVTEATDLAAAPRLIEDLAGGIEALNRSGGRDHVLRQDLSVKARDLMLALQTPRETSIKHIWGEVRMRTSRLPSFRLLVAVEPVELKYSVA
jgi:hypothetical protein